MKALELVAATVPAAGLLSHSDFAPLEFAFNLRSYYGIVSVPSAAVARPVRTSRPLPGS